MHATPIEPGTEDVTASAHEPDARTDAEPCSGPIAGDTTCSVTQLPTLELPSALPLRGAHRPRIRTHTLRGMTRPHFEHAPKSPLLHVAELERARAVETLGALSSTTMHGERDASGGDRYADERARWSERCDLLYPDGASHSLLSETLRELEPRRRADSTLRTSLVRPGIAEARAVQRAAPSSHTGTVITAGLAALLLALACAAKLPVSGTVSAAGVMDSSRVGNTLDTPVAGIVTEVAVEPGAHVRAGQMLAVVDPAALREQLALSLRALALIEQRQRDQQERQVLAQRTMDGLRAQAVALRHRYDADGQRMARLREQRRSYERLMERGSGSQGELDELAQLVHGVARDLLSGEQEIVNNQQKQLALEQARTRDADALGAEWRAAYTTRRSLEAALAQGTLLAPAEGRFEGPLLKVGERVSAGALVARVVPLQTPMRATLELPSPQHVHLRVGAAATLKVEEPGLEPWVVQARISAITTLATLQADGTSSGPITSMRVEVVLEDADAPAALMPGTHVSASLDTASRPLLTAAMEAWSELAETL